MEKTIITSQVGFVIGGVISITLLDLDLKMIIAGHLILTIGYFVRYLQESLERYINHETIRKEDSTPINFIGGHSSSESWAVDVHLSIEDNVVFYCDQEISLGIGNRCKIECPFCKNIEK
jgi:hypothetical protein